MVHQTPHRIRIKIPCWERQDAYFAALQRELEGRPDVLLVQVNALVASVVIHCCDGFDITSVRHCLKGLEVVLPASASGRRPRQIAPVQLIGDRSKSSTGLVGLVVRLTIAIATRQFVALIMEVILGAAVRALLRRLYPRPTRLGRLASPRTLLAAAAG